MLICVYMYICFTGLLRCLAGFVCRLESSPVRLCILHRLLGCLVDPLESSNRSLRSERLGYVGTVLQCSMALLCSLDSITKDPFGFPKLHNKGGGGRGVRGAEKLSGHMLQ